MVPVLTAAEMRAADRRTIEEVGLPGAVLMETAGGAVAALVRERYPGLRRPLILCGKGNNGGDGLVVARRLLDLDPLTCLVGERGAVKGDARLHMGAFERAGGKLSEVPDASAWALIRDEALRTGLVVDALLGTGLDRAPDGLMAQVIGDLAALQGRVPVVSVDIPSGVSSDTGDVAWQTVSASLTVTFAAPKYGHVLPPACDHVGELVVADIGVPRGVLRSTGARLWLLDGADATPAFGGRAPGSHKGSYGHVLVIAGSVGKSGAAILAATAALRGGAGLVTVATAAPVLSQVAAGRPEVMTEPLSVGASGGLDRSALERALSLARSRDAVVLGPGLGQQGGTAEFVRGFIERCPVGLVLDADGLNALGSSERRSGSGGFLRGGAPVVMTPHPGEMARLVGSGTEEVQRRRLETARALAVESGAVVVLKGQRSLVADPEGRAAVCPTGNPGMATAGTGDVLAGIIGALMARGKTPWLAAVAGVYTHGLAGDIAAIRRGQDSLLAGDVLECLPDAILSVLSEHALEGSHE